MLIFLEQKKQFSQRQATLFEILSAKILPKNQSHILP